MAIPQDKPQENFAALSMQICTSSDILLMDEILHHLGALNYCSS